VTLSSEGADQPSLSLDDACAGAGCNAQNALVEAVAAANAKTAVVMSVPGAVLTPWRTRVGALLTNFMPGQQAGHAIADVLFGKVNPSARLPLTFPAAEDDIAFDSHQWPGWPDPRTPAHADYSEGLLVGYRYYDAFGLEPAYPFGHGLSYTTFSYSSLAVNTVALTVSFTLHNVGARDGAEVAQLYLAYPPSAGEPPRVLRGFRKVSLAAGKSETVTFQLEKQDLSVWSVTAHDWAEVKGTYGVHVGASSRDDRLTGTLVYAP